jgi:hypothetical protein
MLPWVATTMTTRCPSDASLASVPPGRQHFIIRMRVKGHDRPHEADHSTLAAEELEGNGPSVICQVAAQALSGVFDQQIAH